MLATRNAAGTRAATCKVVANPRAVRAVRRPSAPAATGVAAAHPSRSHLRGAVTADLENKELPLNLYSSKKPFVGKVLEIRDMGGRDKERHVSHIVIDTGGVPFVEGQSFGVIPPGTKLNSKGKEVAHGVRLYSIASSRYGDARDGRTATLCVVRVIYKNEAGEEVRGLCSNYLCDRSVGDELVMTGPSGTVMLLPDDHLETPNIVCISTGTGIAPFRSFWRRLFYDQLPEGAGYKGRFWLYSGFANQDSVLYADELSEMSSAYPDSFHLRMALSLERKNRHGGLQYVQDLIEEDADAFLSLMTGPSTQFYLCGLKRMYTSVLETLEHAGKERGIDTAAVIAQLKKEHRWHVETA